MSVFIGYTWCGCYFLMELPFFREMLFLKEREGTLWSPFFPVRVTSFQKGFGVLMSDLPPLQMSYLLETI